MKFGYARVSTVKQTTARQIDALKSAGCDEIYEEKVSGTRTQRPELDRLLDKLRPGDVLVVYELKRLGRSSKQLLQLAEDFRDRDIGLVSLTENFDTTTPMGRCVFTFWCALAQLDRDIIAENTRTGLEAAKARGSKIGRRGLDAQKVKLLYSMYDTGKFSMRQIGEAVGVSKQAVSLYVKKRREQSNGNK